MSEKEALERIGDWDLLFEAEGEFRTKLVVRIDGDYYYIDRNGGERGAWQNRPTQAEAIDLTEARRLGLELDYSLEEVARKTATAAGRQQ